VYRWIWRHLPDRRRPLTAALLAAAVVWVLWYVVFPAIGPVLPIDRGTVHTEVPTVTASPTAQPVGGP
jgi:hypothetical protein